MANYPITCSGAVAANYTIGYGAEELLAVTQAPLTISPLPAFKVYGDPLPAFSLGYTGFVLNQGPAVLGGTPVFATPVTTSSVVGTYPVTVSGLTATNYAITFQPGVLTVTKATPVYSNLTSPVISSGAAPTTLGGTLSYAGLFPSGSVTITLNSVAQSAAIAGGAFSSSFATGALPSGSWTVTYSYPGDANFNPANATSTLKVSGSQATFQTTGSLGTPRSFHTATLLPSGKVLIAGGKDASGKALATAEGVRPFQRKILGNGKYHAEQSIRRLGHAASDRQGFAGRRWKFEHAAVRPGDEHVEQCGPNGGTAVQPHRDASRQRQGAHCGRLG